MNVTTSDLAGDWKEYTLTNDKGMMVRVLNFGGIIREIQVPDRNGSLENVVLGYRSAANYKEDTNYFGALIGRVAGRIAGASFMLEGREYNLGSNDGSNHLHGGTGGFHQVLWEVEPFETEDTVGLMLSHESPDGAGGYPGNLMVTVTYTLNQSNQLTLDYQAKSDKTTVFTMTNHSHFNLSGDLKNTVHQHQLMMDSSRFIELDDELIPTGRVLNVDGTAFDFRQGRELGDGFGGQTPQHRVAGGGYDHYFLFDPEKAKHLMVREPASGRKMEIETEQPGMVMYTDNQVGEDLELAEGMSRKHLGVCFETQGSPASLHHDGFPSVILQAGELYEKQTVFTFSVE